MTILLMSVSFPLATQRDPLHKSTETLILQRHHSGASLFSQIKAAAKVSAPVADCCAFVLVEASNYVATCTRPLHRVCHFLGPIPQNQILDKPAVTMAPIRRATSQLTPMQIRHNRCHILILSVDVVKTVPQPIQQSI